MLKFVIGLILLVAPFSIIFLFKDKKKGFLYVLLFLFLFHTVLAVLTQALGVFYYWLIISTNILADIALMVFFFRKKTAFKIPKIDWILILVIVIASLALYQVHYNYTGKINLATDKVVSYHEVNNMKYVYPYFSDEWYAVSLIKYSINSHSLPLKNIFNNNFFLNFEMFFHSLLAEIMLLLNLNPIIQYTFVSIFSNVLIIVLAYIFLRLNNVSKSASAISSLSILYITSGANLPGIWHFIPVNLGIIFSLIGFCFMAMDKLFMAVLLSFFVIFFYGPLFIFYGLALLVYALLKFLKTKEKIFKAVSYFLIVLFLTIPTAYVVLMISPLAEFSRYIVSKLFYISFTGFNIPQFYFYNIIPVWVILLAVLGISFVLEKKKWLFAVFLLGVFYWVFYSFSIYRFVIEYERVIFFTSIITAIISGFGLEKLEKYINFRFENIKFPILKYAEIGVLLFFLLFIPFYTRISNWEKLILVDPRNGVKSYPKSPANNYLTEDDLRIFQSIENKKFLSIPWKGTVLGVATNNYPVSTKQGTISVGDEKTIDIFLSSNCEEKKNMAKIYNLDYIYIDEFDCPTFEKTAKSKEGLVLYKIKQDK